MDRPDQTQNPGSPPSDSETDERTGLPGLRTWRGVYYFVLIVFVVCIVLLKALELAF